MASALRIFIVLAPLIGRASRSFDRDATGKERPVMKVVRMLQDMKAELTKDLEDDKAVHEQLDCWCKTNEKEKTQAIELGQAKSAQLEAAIGEAMAKIKELKAKRAATLDELNSDIKALQTAREMRMKETKEFHSEEMDLQDAINACKNAITVLSEYHPELAQVRAVAHALQTARVPELMLTSGGLRHEQVNALKGFLSHAATSASFLAIPGFQSYAPQSGQIFGILKQMNTDFQKSLSEAQKAEKKAIEEFEALKAAKEDEIASGKKSMAQIDSDLADLAEKHAEDLQELDDTQKQLALDTEFLANLKKKCAQSDEEFDKRLKMRMEELVAVDETIEILNSDESFDVFDKSVNSFIQVSASEAIKKQLRRQRAASLLKSTALKTGSPQLALIAASAQLDAFTKVKAEIDRLVGELNQQQKDEVAHRDDCTEQMNTNARLTAAADDKSEALQTKIADLKSSIKTLTRDIESKTAAIAEMQEQMKRASETREAEAADFHQTVNDQRLTQMILEKALARMKQVYEFLQQQPGAPHIQTSGTKTDPGNGPAAFKEYEQNGGGNRVVAAIEEIMADSKKTEDEAIATEQDSQTAYENFMKDSNKAITEYTKAVVNMTEAKAKAEESLSMEKSDLTATILELEGLHETLGSLHKACDYILKNFDARQAARAAEINALQEAKAILSGMK